MTDKPRYRYDHQSKQWIKANVFDDYRFIFGDSPLWDTDVICKDHRPKYEFNRA